MMTDEYELRGMETGKLMFKAGGPTTDTDIIVKQAVTVRGVRAISRREVEDIGAELAIARARIDLQNTFDVWLWINMPIGDWRHPPLVEHQIDFMCDRILVQIYARGRLDIDVRLADHQAWFVELP